MTERRVLTLEPIADDAEVGRWLSAMEEARARTLRELVDVTDGDLERTPDPLLNSMGSLLYHVALIEADWLIDDILDDAALWPTDVFPERDRDEAGRLTVITSETKEQHLERLRVVRALFLDKMRGMPGAEFHVPRARARYDVSPAWVVHHLLQHEAEHRSHIAYVRDALARA